MSDTTTQPIPTTTSIPAPLKNRLLAKNRKVIKSLDLDGDKVHLCKPTQGDRVKVLEAARQAGELDENDKPTTPRNALRLAGRITACVLYDPGTGQRIYGEEDINALIEDAVWLEDVQEDVQAAFAPSMKDVRGKSEPTPS